jgi:hypothetical protein
MLHVNDTLWNLNDLDFIHVNASDLIDGVRVMSPSMFESSI